MSSSDWRNWPQWDVAQGDFRPLWGTGSEKEGFRSGAEQSPDPKNTSCTIISDPVEKARSQADAIVEEARKRAEVIEKEAFDKGFQQGERAGRQMIEESMGSALKALEEALARWRERADELMAQVEQEAVKLSLAIARKIVNREIRLDPTLVLDVIKAAIRSQPISGEITIRINPMDEETVREGCEGILKEFRELKGIRIEADPAVQRGGALVECDLGELDARLERQFQELEEAFQRHLAPRGTPSSLDGKESPDSAT
jgi:flagellar assembly protein FliH